MRFNIKKPYVEFLKKRKEYKPGDFIEIDSYIKATKLAMYGVIDRKPVEKTRGGRPSRARIKPKEKAVTL